MPNNSSTQAALAADPHFRLRVRHALDTVAWTVANEAESTPNHDARVGYAGQVIRNLDGETTILLPSIVTRPNVFNFETTYVFDFELQVGQVVSATGDPDLLSQIATDWDDLAAAAGFEPPTP